MRPSSRSAVLLMPAYLYLALIGLLPFDPALQGEPQAWCTFFWRAFIVCLVVYVQTSAHRGWKQQGWPTYARPSYILYMMQSDIQDIFAQVTSGASYHLFTVCTPFGTSTNVDCDPTVANTTDFLSAFLFSVNLDSLNCHQHLPPRWTIILKWAFSTPLPTGLWEQPLQADCTNN